MYHLLLLNLKTIITKYTLIDLKRTSFYLKKYMKLYYSLLALIIVGSSCSAQKTYWQQHADYKMDIKMDVTKHQFSGYQKLTYTNNSPDTLTSVFYHLYYNVL